MSFLLGALSHRAMEAVRNVRQEEVEISWMRVQLACLVDTSARPIDTDNTRQQGLAGEGRCHRHHAIVESSV